MGFCGRLIEPFLGAFSQGLICCLHRSSLGGGRGSSNHVAKDSMPEDADVARKRFGNAKSISSAQFNAEQEGTNDYEKQVSCFPLPEASGDVHDDKA